MVLRAARTGALLVRHPRAGQEPHGQRHPCYKSCRIEVHAEDQRNKVPGYKSHGNVSTYSCRHIKKYAGLEYLV